MSYKKVQKDNLTRSGKKIHEQMGSLTERNHKKEWNKFWIWRITMKWKIEQRVSTQNGWSGRICELEDRNFEFINSEEKKKEWKRVKKAGDLRYNIRRNNLRIIRVPEREEGERAENLFKEIIAENF